MDPLSYRAVVKRTWDNEGARQMAAVIIVPVELIQTFFFLRLKNQFY